MTREERVSLHKKQERTNISSGAPRSSELKEGVSEVRNIHGLGVVEYTKVNGAVVENVLNRPPSKAIRDLRDSTGGTSGGNTVSNFGAAPLNLAAAASVADAENAVATIIAKLNAILDVLRDHKLIEKFDKL